MGRITNRARLEKLVDAWEPVLRVSFLDAAMDVASKAELGRIIERLEKGDISGAVSAVHLDEAAFRNLDTAIAQAFNAGGSDIINSLPKLRDPAGGRLVVRWDGRNIRAEQWLRNHSSSLITRIVADQRASIRAALTTGLQAGRGPRSVALDLIGRVSTATGQRTGGLLGLTAAQGNYVTSARAELLSGNFQAYLKRVRRDKRFDSTVLRAIKDETPLDAATISRMIGRYSDRLLELRGTTIARTETISALNQSNVEAMNQVIESGAVQQRDVTKTWHASLDSRVRDSHAELDGETVGVNDMFSNGMAYPGDPSGGSEEVINCRCWLEIRTDFTADLIRHENRFGIS